MGRSKMKLQTKVDIYNNVTFHIPWKYNKYYRCAYKKQSGNSWYYCRCMRDGSIRRSENCNTDCPHFKVRFKDKLRACWYILTKGFKFI